MGRRDYLNKYNLKEEVVLTRPLKIATGSNPHRTWHRAWEDLGAGPG